METDPTWTSRSLVDKDGGQIRRSLPFIFVESNGAQLQEVADLFSN